MKKLLLLLGLLVCPLIGRTQAPVYQNVIFVSSAPSGACTNGSPARIVISTGILYTCQAGTWGSFGTGSGTVTSVSGTTNQVDVATGTTTPVVSLDSAITLPGSLTAPTGGSVTFSGTGIVNSNEINGTLLSGLATGLLKNTTATGVPSIAVAGTDYVGLASANTLSGLNTFSNSPTASAFGLLFSGTPTTSSLYFPVVGIDTTGATVPTRIATGTMFEINAPSGFNGDLIAGYTNGGASVLTVDHTGGVTSGGFGQFSGNMKASTFQFFSGSDTQFCRVSALLIDLGNQSSCNSLGTLQLAGLESGGTKFTTSGCSVSSTTGGATAGKMTLGAATCSVVITMNGASGLTANNGWSCKANDETTAAANSLLYFSSNNATTATLSVPATAGGTDVVDFHCVAF